MTMFSLSFLCIIWLFPLVAGYLVLPSTRQHYLSRYRSTSSDVTSNDLNTASVKEVLYRIRQSTGDNIDLPLYKEMDVARSKPTINKYVIANPKAFFDANNYDIVKNYIDIDYCNKIIEETGTLTLDVIRLLPIIYIADIHSEYGTLGFMLNKPSTKTMNDIHPEYKIFRNRPIYEGGLQNKGSSFTMLHKKIGFPENRTFKTIPTDSNEQQNNDFRLFFSPDIAMANELCSTNDAKPNDFKFFTWSTVWSPKQLDLEYSKKLWITIQGPCQLIFDDAPTVGFSLYHRILCSIPASRIS